MTEPVKVLPMAKLLRMAREKEEKARAEAEKSAEAKTTPALDPSDSGRNDSQTYNDKVSTLPQRTIPHKTIVQETIPHETILDDLASRNLTAKTHPSSKNPGISEDSLSRNQGKKNSNNQIKGATKTLPHQTIPDSTIPHRTIPTQNIVNEKKGYYPIFNDISDRLIPELQLDPYQQAVFHRLYRLSRGWKSEECEVGLGTLAKQCVMSRSQVQRSLTKLTEKGLIENLGNSKQGGREGNRYKVLPGMTKATQTIPPQTIVAEEKTISYENTEVTQSIVSESTIKNNNKDFKNNTHNDREVGVKSKFSLEDCRAYAEHLSSTGQGINNPGGYALSIYKSGIADELMEKFKASAPKSQEHIDTGKCPDCHGTGMFYPEGFERGAAKCRHEKLA